MGSEGEIRVRAPGEYRRQQLIRAMTAAGVGGQDRVRPSRIGVTEARSRCIMGY